VFSDHRRSLLNQFSQLQKENRELTGKVTEEEKEIEKEKKQIEALAKEKQYVL
jgi:peptidoglycan hydrolase CwlO-like protein